MTHRAYQILTIVAAALLVGLTGCAEDQQQAPVGSDNSGRSASNARQQRVDQLEIVFPYGSEKKMWVNAVTEQFNRDQRKTSGGKVIHVKAIAMGSGETVTEIMEGRLEAHLMSPASAAFIRLGNAESQAKFGNDLVDRTTELVLSPVVIAMWKPMAEAIGWGERPVGWSDILELVRNEEGWGAYGYPQWGQFKFGHTHPEYSNSGLISLFAEVYAATGKKGGLTIADVEAAETGAFLREIEQSVVHYGSSTGFFGRRLFGSGPTYLSAAVLYENMVIESYDRAKYPDLPFPVVAIYPKEGTFWSDHPVGIVNRDWVTAEHREAAQVYIDYLLEPAQQQAAVQFGFRPADLTVAVGAPIDLAHGVDPDEPKTTLEVPPVDVMHAINQLWHDNKKRANVVLVLDTSGSMKGERLAAAKRGARELVNMLSDEDQLSLLQFSNLLNWIVKEAPLEGNRPKFERSIDSLIAQGGTSLYDAIEAAHRYISENPTPDRISAVVVLTDGKDENSNLAIEQLMQRVRFDGEAGSIRVFTIGYGSGASKDILTRIADETQAKFHAGDPENIREVFKGISTFF